MRNIFPTICAHDVPAVRDFYSELFDCEVLFDSGWYVQLASASDLSRQLGIVERGHASVPVEFQRAPAGVLVSIEVDDVDAVHRRARAAGHRVVLDLRDEVFGQRHFMTVDPAGTLVDVITEIEPGAEIQQFGVTSVAGGS